MSQSNANLHDIFTDIATAIRGKTGSNALIAPRDMADAISGISAGGEKPKLYKSIKAWADDYSTIALYFSTANGGFQSHIKYTINGETYVTEWTAGKPGNSDSVASIHADITTKLPLAGGTKVTITGCNTAEGFEDSDTFSFTYKWKEATETTGYCSVSGIGNESPTSQTYTYDSSFPRSFQEVTDIYGNKFIKIPTMYRSITVTDGKITGFKIATSKVDNTYEPYPCFVDETNNNAILPFILIGKYACSSTSTANSVKATKVSMKPYEAHNLCASRGTGYLQYDWKINRVFADLGLVLTRIFKFGTSAASGQLLGVLFDPTNGMRTYVDGVYLGASDDRGGLYVCADERNYVGYSTAQTEATLEAAGYTRLSYEWPDGSTTYCGKQLGYDPNMPFAWFANENGASGNGVYICQQFAPKTANGMVPLYSQLGYGELNANWWLGWSSAFSVSYSVSGCCRLCYRPINGATGYVESNN